MSDVSEVINNLEAAIYDALAAISGITDVVGTNIIRGTAQMYTGHPVIVYQRIAGGDINETPVRRLDLLYEFVMVTTVSPAQAASIAGLIDETLHGATLTVAGWTNILSRVEDSVGWTEFRIQPAYETFQDGRYIRFVLTKS